MITLYGRTLCGSCEMVKRKLTQKSIDFEYINMDDMEEGAAKAIETLARDAGLLMLPIVMVDGNVVEFKDALKNT